MTVTWILERNVFAETCFVRMLAHFSDHDIPYHIVRVIPFVHEIEGRVPDVENPVVVYGSIGTQKLVVDHDWSPGVWTGPLFNETEMLYRIGFHALNHDAICCTLREAPRQGMDEFFIKPNSDTKEFAGTITTVADCAGWVRRMIKMGYFEGNILDLPVVVSSPKNIGAEWRIVVVNGKPVAATCYKQAGKTVAVEGAPQDVMNYAFNMSQWFSPADVFVMDVCQHENEETLRVVEYNTFNSAGLYECDVGAIIDAINVLVDNKTGG